jgi:GntR family transcriptional regulator
VRVTGGSEVICAVVPDAAQRSLLGIGPGVAALAIDRLGCAGEEPVEWRHTLVRADRFSVTARFSAADGYRVGGA